MCYIAIINIRAPFGISGVFGVASHVQLSQQSLRSHPFVAQPIRDKTLSV